MARPGILRPASDAAAVAAGAFRGGMAAVIERDSPLDLAALRRPQNRDFARLHAIALSEGSATMVHGAATPDPQGSPSQ